MTCAEAGRETEGKTLKGGVVCSTNMGQRWKRRETVPRKENKKRDPNNHREIERSIEEDKKKVESYREDGRLVVS